jgi:hypothetical protein
MLLPVFVLSVLARQGHSAHAQQPTKTVTFAVEGKPWREVFDRLTEGTGKPVVATDIPDGKFPSLGIPKEKYTIPQVIDLINEALQSKGQTQKRYLVNFERLFTLLSADNLDPALLPRVQRDDLFKHGNSEMVVVVLPLLKIDAAKTATAVKLVMWPRGEVVPIGLGSNALVLMDRVGKLKALCLYLAVLDKISPIPPALPR